MAAAQVRLAALQTMACHVETRRLEIARAVDRIRAMADHARTVWKDNALVGRDTGPTHATTLIPEDAQPDIAGSVLATELFADIAEENETMLSPGQLSRFISRWIESTAGPSLLPIGSEDSDEQTAAEKALGDALLEEARQRALSTRHGVNHRSRLPRGIESAQSTKGVLEGALQGLVERSRRFWCSWDWHRIQLYWDETPKFGGPPTHFLATVLRLPDGLAHLERAVNEAVDVMPHADPERVVALSAEWALPVHALREIPTWKMSYEHALALHDDKPYLRGPVHIDPRFPDDLDPLSPGEA